MLESRDPELTQQLASFRQSIPDQVRLIAVTKTQPIAAMIDTYAAGIRDIGESRVQEAIEKKTHLTALTDLTWHMIGQLQSNKVRKALDSVWPKPLIELRGKWAVRLPNFVSKSNSKLIPKKRAGYRTNSWPICPCWISCRMCKFVDSW
jgi:hypothetical protein